MKDGQQYAGVGLFFLIGVVLLYLTYNALITDLQRNDDGYEVRASFDDLLQLRRGDQVRMAGVVIGVVTSTELEGREAVAMLSIKEKYEIPADSSATINMAGLLGTNYISVDMGTSDELLAAGASIRTRPSFDINAALEKVGDLAGSVESTFSGLGTVLSGDGSGDSLFSQIGDLLKANGGNLTDSIANIRRISGQIAEGQGTVGRLIYEDGAYDEILSTAASIRAAAERAELLIENADKAIADASGVFSDIKSGNGLLGALVYDESVATEFRQITGNLATFSERLTNAESTVGRLLTNEDLYLEVRSVVRKANRTLDSLSDSAPISAVGVAVSALF